MCLAQGPQRSDAGEARTSGPSVSSQALYHWATALPATVSISDIFVTCQMIKYGEKHIIWLVNGRTMRTSRYFRIIFMK